MPAHWQGRIALHFAVRCYLPEKDVYRVGSPCRAQYSLMAEADSPPDSAPDDGRNYGNYLCEMWHRGGGRHGAAAPLGGGLLAGGEQFMWPLRPAFGLGVALTESFFSHTGDFSSEICLNKLVSAWQ